MDQMTWSSYYYELHQIPDLTLSKYAELDEGDVEGVLERHQAFWRQINRRGLLLNEGYQLLYEYNPARPVGQRLKICMRFDTASPFLIEETLHSSSINAYFPMEPMDTSDPASPGGTMVRRKYRYAAHLIKKERVMRPMQMESTQDFYIVSTWEMNETARLYNMMKLMTAADQPCVYCVSFRPSEQSQKMRENLDQILHFLRKSIQLRISKSAASVGVNEKDENAKDTLDAYEDLLKALDESPHFLVDVQVLADDPNLAQYILDAAVSEALSKGSHDVRTYEENVALCDMSAGMFPSCAGSFAPEKLQQLPHLFLLEELSAFAVFPTLYPGEFVDFPKETLPELYEAGLTLGRDNEGHTIRFPLKNLSKHAFLAGVPGSGKTNSMMHLITSMHVTYQIPVLILEPAKHEYRVLTSVPGMEDLELFSPSANTTFPLHINPFEFPAGMTLAEHIRNLIEVFDGAFTLEPPMPFLLDSSIEEVYRDHDWLPAMVNRPGLGFTYPTLSELYEKVADKLEHTDYEAEIKGNLKSVLQVRIGSLLTREMGDVFNVPYSTLPPEAWLKRSAVIELESMGKYPANFLSLLLSTLIRETLKVEDYVKGPDGRPRHVIFFEEAHNLIGPTAEQSNDGKADTKIAATALLVKMLAEVRALGEGIVIADQLPTAMAPEIIKNTSLKIGLRITAQDDRELLGGTMSADAVQLERMGVFSPGHALCSYEPLLKPFEVQIPEFKNKENSAEMADILRNLVRRPRYQEDVERSLDIHEKGWAQRSARIWEEWNGMKAAWQAALQTNDVKAGLALRDTRDKLVREQQNLFLDVVAYRSMMLPIQYAIRRVSQEQQDEAMAQDLHFFEAFNQKLESQQQVYWAQYDKMYKLLKDTKMAITDQEESALGRRANAFKA